MDRQLKKDEFIINTACFLLLFLFLIVFYGSFGFLAVIFGLLFVPSEFDGCLKALKISIAVFIICGFNFGILNYLRKGINGIYETIGVQWSERCKYDTLIGLGLISLGGIVPRFMVFFMERNDNILIYCFLIYPITSAIIYQFFVTELHNSYKPYGQPDLFLFILAMVLSNITLILAACRISTFYADDKISAMIGISQVFLGILSGSSSTEFIMVLRDFLRPKKKVLEGEVSKKVGGYTMIMMEPKEDEETRIECKICLLEYCADIVPRILTECGHTICEICAGNLLKKNHGSLLLCPFCQMVTAVNGSVKRLPKNHDVLEYVTQK